MSAAERQTRYRASPRYRATLQARMRTLRYKSAAKEAQFFHRLLRDYGLTLDQYHAMFEAQGERCGLCQEPFEDTPHVDHEHQSGLVRKLLCRACNHLLGNAREQKNILLAAIAYLEQYQ